MLFYYIFSSSFFLLSLSLSYRVIFEEYIAPLVLNVEEEPKDEEEVDCGDEDDNHQPAVQAPPTWAPVKTECIPSIPLFMQPPPTVHGTRVKTECTYYLYPAVQAPPTVLHEAWARCPISILKFPNSQYYFITFLTYNSVLSLLTMRYDMYL